MKLARNILDSKGKEVWSIEPGATVLDAIRLMAEKRIGALLVMEGESLVGVFSERDYARKVILVGKSSRETPVNEIMSSKVVSTGNDNTVEECMTLMTKNRIRHLPVVDKEMVVGVLSIGDLVNAIIEDQKYHIEQLESYITTG